MLPRGRVPDTPHGVSQAKYLGPRQRLPLTPTASLFINGCRVRVSRIVRNASQGGRARSGETGGWNFQNFLYCKRFPSAETSGAFYFVTKCVSTA
jgi:hypothetical protein